MQPAHPHTTPPPQYPAIGLQGRVGDALDALCRPDADGFAQSVPPDDGDRWSWSAIVRMVTDRLGPYAGADADSVYGPVARYVMAETAADWVTVGYGPMTRHALIVAEQAGVTARCVAPYAVTLWLSDAAGERAASIGQRAASAPGVPWGNHVDGVAFRVDPVTATQDQITYPDGRAVHMHVGRGEFRDSRPANSNRVAFRVQPSDNRTARVPGDALTPGDVIERMGNGIVRLDGSVSHYPFGWVPDCVIDAPELYRHADCTLCAERRKHWHEYSLA